MASTLDSPAPVQIRSPSSGSSNGPGSGVGGPTRFAMSMWFEVRVDGIVKSSHLGKWSACNGLAVKLKTEAIPSGIRHDLPRVAPVAVEYPEVTLERAVRSGEEKEIQEWLQDYVDKWMLDDEAGATEAGAAKAGEGGAKSGTTVTIALFSALSGSAKQKEDHLVAEWTLHNAYPVAWTGPTLSAKGSDLAMEKLTFAHGGFLHKAAPGNPSTAKIKIADYDGKSLDLQFQPTDISMDKSVVSSSRANATVSNQSDLATNPDKMNVGFTVRFEGKKAVKDARERLFEWLKPVTITTGTGKAETKKEEQEALKLTIGNIGEKDATLRSVSASFKRFGKDGDPIRATFALKFEIFEPNEEKAPSPAQATGMNDLIKNRPKAATT